jgi:ATP-dependent Clp protease adaptor protein ClpS
MNQAVRNEAEQSVAVRDAPAEVDAPADAVTRRERMRGARKPKRQPRYHVVLWDDNHHTYAYVILMMVELFGYQPEKGYEIAKEVDTRGRAIVITTTKEHAELKRDQIHAYGKDALIDGCQGSMWATLEPCE